MVAVRIATPSTVFEVTGVSTYEDAEILLMLETMSGSFGNDHEGVVLTKPGANLRKANLFEATLKNCNLSGADLYKSTLMLSDLRGSNMSGCNLVGVNGNYSNMSHCDLSNSKMWASYFRECNLDGANLRGAETMVESIRRDMDTNFESSFRPTGPLPPGWDRTEDGLMVPKPHGYPTFNLKRSR